jgi:hypothetical protein
VLAGKLDRLLTLRGDPARGLPATAWAETFDGVDRELLLRAAIAAVRSLLITDWADLRREDKRPQEALDATEAWLSGKTPEALVRVKAAAKACTAARGETFGKEHRVPEAARAIAWTAGGKDEANLWSAFAGVEEELLARIALTGEYHRGPEQRRALVEAVRNVVLPPEEPAEEAAVSRASAEPVPYSADGHFELGQRLIHKKFGDVVVASVGETWIEVELGDGTKKRLAHKP